MCVCDAVSHCFLIIKLIVCLCVCRSAVLAAVYCMRHPAWTRRHEQRGDGFHGDRSVPSFCLVCSSNLCFYGTPLLLMTSLRKKSVVPTHGHYALKCVPCVCTGSVEVCVVLCRRSCCLWSSAPAFQQISHHHDSYWYFLGFCLDIVVRASVDFC